MLFFSQRLKLCELFCKWCEEKRVKVCEESFIAWLSGQNLLNEDKCHEIISKEIEKRGVKMSAISADNMKKAYVKANENNYVSKGEVVLALLEKGQHSTRYKLGDTWELNLFEIQEAIDNMESEDVVATKDIYKFYYCESEDDYYVGKRIDTLYYAKYNPQLRDFVWCMSKYLPWGEHIVDENTLWKEHTYPSEPVEIGFTEWIRGFIKKYVL